MNRSIAVLFFVLPFVFSSCNLLKKKPSRRNVTVDSTATTIVDTQETYVVSEPIMSEPVPVEPSVSSAVSPEKQQLISALTPLLDKRIDFQTFKGKAKMHYEGSGMRQDFTANFRLAKDSVIWAHITAGMGIVNVARILITPDSFWMVNYMDKSVMAMSAAEAAERLPAAVNFDLLQDLIIGNALESEGTPVDATDFGGTWSLNIAAPDVQQQINYNKVDSTMRSQQVLSALGGGLAGMIQYGNYDKVGSKQFAISRAINIESNNQQHYLDMNFNNATFDEPLEFPFSIPSEYSLNK